MIPDVRSTVEAWTRTDDPSRSTCSSLGPRLFICGLYYTINTQNEMRKLRKSRGSPAPGPLLRVPGTRGNGSGGRHSRRTGASLRVWAFDVNRARRMRT
ncbi:hypothetical protein EVAR_97319_1 [Eumeta japonica]|uniref:Uncharacterized protein n=1 Tax=Eumeta variegata TaxID=151549 RepID=A0A4C1X5C0_EUMVA|nr:hypothetical protein EVAR_97319_1 [Eumeta japonica]